MCSLLCRGSRAKPRSLKDRLLILKILNDQQARQKTIGNWKKFQRAFGRGRVVNESYLKLLETSFLSKEKAMVASEKKSLRKQQAEIAKGSR